MAARSSGIFPREGFDLDEAGKITATATGTDAPFTLTAAKTIRVVVIGASGIDNAGTNKITITLGGQEVVFNAADLDGNGVGIAHIRGALCDADDNDAYYTLGGTAAIAGGVYLDLVDGPAR
jgi:hypothetical protein